MNMNEQTDLRGFLNEDIREHPNLCSRKRRILWSSVIQSEHY